MWKDDRTNYDDIIEAVLARESLPSAKCCEAPELHYFLYQFENDRWGSAWVWCSRCRSFSHYDGVQLPKGFKNCPDISISDLYAEPKLLELKKDVIGEYNLKIL